MYLHKYNGNGHFQHPWLHIPIPASFVTNTLCVYTYTSSFYNLHYSCFSWSGVWEWQLQCTRIWWTCWSMFDLQWNTFHSFCVTAADRSRDTQCLYYNQCSAMEQMCSQHLSMCVCVHVYVHKCERTLGIGELCRHNFEHTSLSLAHGHMLA